MSQATRRDSGLYEAQVQNELGCDISTFSVIVLGNQKYRFIIMRVSVFFCFSKIKLCMFCFHALWRYLGQSVLGNFIHRFIDRRKRETNNFTNQTLSKNRNNAYRNIFLVPTFFYFYAFIQRNVAVGIMLLVCLCVRPEHC